MSKICSLREAVGLLSNGDVLATGGFVGVGFAELLAIGLAERFVEEGQPTDLTLIYAAGQGDAMLRGGLGLNHLGQEGLLKRVIGGHYGMVPAIQVRDFVIIVTWCRKWRSRGKLRRTIFLKGSSVTVRDGFFLHSDSLVYRDVAAHKPRTISRVGLGTFVDPRNGGGKIRPDVFEDQPDIVELIEFDGVEYLAYKPTPVDVCFVRGTTADANGNISMEKEALTLEGLAIATATRNSGGKVIIQVERVAEVGTIPSRQVQIPGILVDAVVVCDEPELYHCQTFAEDGFYNPAFSGEIRVPLEDDAKETEVVLDAKTIIARRAAFELTEGDVVNLGIGAPEFVADVCNAEGVISSLTLTAEPGVIGGVPAGGLNFGCATNTEALIQQPEQFDFYQGGGLDVAFLGLAQADGQGNLNVSKFGPRLAGCGGFIDISQNAKKIVFTGTLTAGGIDVKVEDGELVIVQEGSMCKFVEEVEHVTFSGRVAAEAGQPVLYVTERCVFRLSDDGEMDLVEVAPGIDIEEDILPFVEFEPNVDLERVSLMDERIFSPERMGLAEIMGQES